LAREIERKKTPSSPPKVEPLNDRARAPVVLWLSEQRRRTSRRAGDFEPRAARIENFATAAEGAVGQYSSNPRHRTARARSGSFEPVPCFDRSPHGCSESVARDPMFHVAAALEVDEGQAEDAA